MQYSLKRRITSDDIDKAVESTFKRDRIIVMGALALVIVFSWGYILAGAGMNMTALEMTNLATGNSTAVMMPAVWDFGYAKVMFLMMKSKSKLIQ